MATYLLLLCLFSFVVGEFNNVKNFFVERQGVNLKDDCLTECPTYWEKSWTRIFSCSSPNNGQLDLNSLQIQQLATTSTQVLIVYNGTTAVVSKANTYPIHQLRRGQTISFRPAPFDSKTDTDVINANWDGTAKGGLWQTCGTADTIDKKLYHACNNQQGLHLTPDQCKWQFSQGYTGPIKVYIDAGSRQKGVKAPGCPACRRYGEKSWTRIYRCWDGPDDGLTITNTDKIKSLADSATQVLINNRDGTYVVSNPGSYPVQQLRNKLTISYQPPAQQTPPNVIAASWTGPANLLGKLSQTCGTPTDFSDRFYHACNNEQGLHLNDRMCKWTYRSEIYDDEIEAFVDVACQCPQAPIVCPGCPYTHQCNPDGTCVPPTTGCQPKCGYNKCGPDGCGGICGMCPYTHTCYNGSCEPPHTPSPTPCQPVCPYGKCGPNGCGGTCDCPYGSTCTYGTCTTPSPPTTCNPVCPYGKCGSDGCGGKCDCPYGSTCSYGTCVSTTTVPPYVGTESPPPPPPRPGLLIQN